MRSWFSLQKACAHCGLRFERDEEEDYLIATWPDPPWTTLIWTGVLQMSLTPILFYPFAKALWLAIDLIFRPMRPEDLE